MTPDSHPASADDLSIPLNERDHIEGSRSAPVILVEYGDYECPDCLNAWPIVKALRQRLPSDLAFVFRHFPQSSIHPRASVAAQAAEAAGMQGRYWEMHDQLFAHQKELATVDLTHLALRIGLEVYRFEAAMELESNTRKIRSDIEGGQQSGVRGTPTFFLNRRRYRSSVTTDAMFAEIERLCTSNSDR